ncbi:MAG: flagellar protein FliJ [Candidatus Poribacteria bacterium]|nr:flagellar protein FliJ [Candidatus Poribacteria bacterium]
MRFKFSLETLQKYRKSIEDQRHLELASLREKQFLEEEKLCEIRDAQRTLQRNFQDKSGKTKVYLLYLDDLSRQSIVQRKTISELSEKVIEARDNLVEASKSKKIIEKLRDQKYEQYRQYQVKQESKVLDEIATNRFSRKDL